MKKLVAVLLAILMLFSLFQGALRENVVKGETVSWKELGTGTNGLMKGIEITSVVVDSKNSDVIYAGTGFYGVYKSEDGGSSWKAITNGINEMTNVLTLAIDPKNTNVVYAGLFNFGRPRIYKTEDGGKTWNVLANSPNYPVFTITIDPNNTNIIYAYALSDGFYRSDDSGANWKKLNLVPQGIQMCRITVDPNNSNVVYIVQYGAIYKSDDKGEHFTELRVGNYAAMSVVVDPNNSNILYASTDGAGIFKSVDGGKNWTQTSLSIANAESISVNPANSNVMYAIDNVRGASGVIEETSDAWSSWKYTDLTGLPNDMTEDKSINKGPLCSLAIDSKGNLFLGTTKGLFKYASQLVDYSVQDFVGYWINDNLKTLSINKIFISISGDEFQVHAYGRCYATDCDWGISTAKLTDTSNGVLNVKWVFSSATENLTIKLIERNHVEVADSCHFTDNSGRQDYTITEYFTKVNIDENYDKFLLSLFKNVNKLTFTGAPGIISTTAQAFPIVISSNDSTPPNQIAVAGSRYGNGFVLGFSHDSFFSDSNFDYFDNKIFTSNILNYALKKKVIISTSHGEYFNQTNANKFTNYLKSLGFEVQFLNGPLTADALSSAGILISGSAWGDINDSEIFAIKDFVNNGGILLLGAVGWSWVSYHSDKTIEDLPANKISKEFGIQWIDGVITELKDFIYNDATVFITFYPKSLFSVNRNLIKNTATITAKVNLGGTIIPIGVSIASYGDSKTFTITPNTGYHIADVKVDGKSVGAVSTYTFENVASDHTIEATFAINTYNITASASSGGSISPSGAVSVNYGESKTFTITPDKGYKIRDVKVDGKSVGAVSKYTFTNVTDNHTIEATFEKNEIVIVLQVGQTTFTVNGSPNTLDSPPIIKNGRTLLPIRPIVEALGGSVSWDGNEKKVTVTLGSTTIELWIGKNTARVNGTDTPIDSSNSKVVPEIINGRTMLPLRFVTENLGCQLQWDPNTKTITITYQG